MESIVDVLINIGDTLQNVKWAEQAAGRRIDDEKNKCKHGYPCGTPLFTFHYDDGIEEYIALDDYRLVRGMHVIYCTPDQPVSDTVEGAIRAAVESWKQSGDLDYDEDIRHFAHDIEYYSKGLERARLVLAIIQEMSME